LPGQPELRQLESFVVAAEELHFTRAAQRLYVTQQALSAQMRQLERVLEVALFRRTTRKVELTEAGRVLLEHVVPLLAAADRAWEAVAQAEAGDSGHVALAYAPIVRLELLPALLAEFGQRYPNVEIRTREVLSEQVGKLTDGSTDVNISRNRPPTGKAIASIPVFYSTLGLMLGRDHPQAQRDSVDLRQLNGEPLKIWPRPFSAGFYDTIVSSLRLGGFTGPIEELANFGGQILIDDPVACAEVASGRAVGFGFDGQYTTLEPEIVWRPILPTLPIPMHLSWRRDASAAARNVVLSTLNIAAAKGWLPEERRAEALRLLDP
jgi:DNA-binding transcriptional LysR family regulator